LKTVELGAVASVDRRVVNPAHAAPDTPYVGLEHIEPGGYISGHDTVGGAKILSAKFRFSSDHVLFGKLRPNLGKICRPDFAGVCSTDILPIRPHDDLDRNYLAHYLSQPTMTEFAASRTSGASLPRLSPAVLVTFPIPLPDLPEQRRIAAILDAADAIRNKRREVLAHLDGLPQAIFAEMFGDGSWSSNIDALAEVQIGPFGSLLHQEDYISGGVPVINPMHIRAGRLHADDAFSVAEAKAQMLTRYRLLPGDVVLGRRGEMGRAGVAGPEHEGILCGTGSLILRPRGVASEFLHAVVTSKRTRAHLELNALGATLPNLNAAIVKEVPAPQPPRVEQAAFAARIAAIDAQRAVVARALTADDELFASLQFRAFRGEL
jgi:type I restriction enzyme S subunit